MVHPSPILRDSGAREFGSKLKITLAFFSFAGQLQSELLTGAVECARGVRGVDSAGISTRDADKRTCQTPALYISAVIVTEFPRNARNMSRAFTHIQFDVEFLRTSTG